MKKIYLMIALMCLTFSTAVLAQNTGSPALLAYYEVKDALVAGNSAKAAESAETLVKSLSVEDKLTEVEKGSLTKSAGLIAKSNDLKVQRENFAPLSTQVIDLVKKKSIAAHETYVQYCPMKKASWLSSETAIMNPFYGSSMLTCGSVKETLKK